jgi:hypothetical protein
VHSILDLKCLGNKYHAKTLGKSPHKTDSLINMDIPDGRHSISKE